MKGLLVFVVGIFLINLASAAYVADVALEAGGCESGYDYTAGFFDPNDVNYHYCVRKSAEFVSGETYVLDALVKTGFGGCPGGYIPTVINGYASEESYTNGDVTEVRLCKRKEETDNSNNSLIDAVLGTDACAEGYNAAGSFVDKDGRTFYFCVKKSAESAIAGGEIREELEILCTSEEQDDLDEFGRTFPFGLPDVIEDTSVGVVFYVDYCIDENTLNESYCTGRAEWTSIFCENGCDAGRCLNAAEARSGVLTTGICYNSEGGVFSNVSGFMEYVDLKGEGHRHYDVCVDANNLHEYSCKSSTGEIGDVGVDLLNCAGGCADGACGDETAAQISEEIPQTDGVILSAAIGDEIYNYLNGETCFFIFCSKRNGDLANRLPRSDSGDYVLSRELQIELFGYLYPHNPGMADNLMRAFLPERVLISEHYANAILSYTDGEVCAFWIFGCGKRNAGMSNQIRGYRTDSGVYDIDKEYMVEIFKYLFTTQAKGFSYARDLGREIFAAL